MSREGPLHIRQSHQNSMSNQSYGRGVPYGMPQYPDQRVVHPRGPPARPPPPNQSSGGYPPADRQRSNVSHRQGLPSQQRPAQHAPRRPPQENPSLRGPGVPMAQRQQWPLYDTGDIPPNTTQPPKGPPPQRPPRPKQANVPAMLDPPRTASNRGAGAPQAIPQYSHDAPSKSKNNQFDYNGPGVWGDDGYTSPTFPAPNLSRPLTGSSLASTSSSYSSSGAPPPLPQVPGVPAPTAQQQQQQQQAAQLQQQQQQRVRPPLGPPPSARRGPSSYYPQQAYVTPIVEETDSARTSLRNGPDSRGSYASSNAIPIGVPDYYLNDAGTPGRERSQLGNETFPFEDDLPIAPPPFHNQEQKRDGSAGLVRQASLGKRSKPTLTTIKSSDNVKTGHRKSRSQGSLDEVVLPQQGRHMHPQEATAITQRVFAPQSDASSSSMPREQTSDSPIGALSNRSGSSGALGKAETSFYDRSSSESEKSSLHRQKSKDYLSEPLPGREPRVTRQPRATAEDPRVESILNRLEKGGAIKSGDPEKNEKPNQPSSLATRVGARRPPPLNVNAVHEAEQRGSLTSLPDLIARATKLASNLDRGRTASRLGFNWMDDEKPKNNKEADPRRSGSLSDMLSSFPPPALPTPRSHASGRFGWPSNLRHSALPSVSDASEAHRRQKKRVCGMPLWLFLLLLLLLIVLIAAAVIVPVVLIVLPRQRDPASSLSACQKALTCHNGGLNIAGQDDSCQCLCINGFTGSTCSVPSGTGCTTTSVGDTSNATLGSAIPRLLSGAQSSYNVPLNGQAILGLFSATNLSCTSENGLVTFNGLTARSLATEMIVSIGSDGVEFEDPGEPSKTLQERQDSSSTVSSAGTAQTSAGIVFATGSPDSGGASSGTSSNDTSPESLDFARTAVLFILQDSQQLNSAIEARQALQNFFTGSSDGASTKATNLTLQNGYSANLRSLSLTVPNGTSIGKA